MLLRLLETDCCCPPFPFPPFLFPHRLKGDLKGDLKGEAPAVEASIIAKNSNVPHPVDRTPAFRLLEP